MNPKGMTISSQYPNDSLQPELGRGEDGNSCHKKHYQNKSEIWSQLTQVFTEKLRKRN